MTELMIRGATVIDGRGSPPQRVDVGLRGGRISQLVAPGGGAAPAEFDARGLLLCPGVIDLHSRADLSLLAVPDELEPLRRGVTLEVLGADGIGAAPVRPLDLADAKAQLCARAGHRDLPWDWRFVGEYAAALASARPNRNAALLAPYRTLRRYVMGGEHRPPFPEEELPALLLLLESALQEGALAVSLGSPSPHHEELEALSAGLTARRVPGLVYLRPQDRLSAARRSLQRLGDPLRFAAELAAPLRDPLRRPPLWHATRTTAWAAGLLGLPDRGQIAPGAWADLLAIDPSRPPSEPGTLLGRVVHVWINGVLALQHGESTGARAGVVVRRVSPPR